MPAALAKLDALYESIAIGDRESAVLAEITNIATYNPNKLRLLDLLRILRRLDLLKVAIVLI
jgi:hypothetical protein